MTIRCQHIEDSDTNGNCNHPECAAFIEAQESKQLNLTVAEIIQIETLIRMANNLTRKERQNLLNKINKAW